MPCALPAQAAAACVPAAVQPGAHRTS